MNDDAVTSVIPADVLRNIERQCQRREVPIRCPWCARADEYFRRPVPSEDGNQHG